MAVSLKLLDTSRDCYEATYEGNGSSGFIQAKFHNQDDGSKSTYKGIDDNTFLVTVGKGFTGTDDMTVSDLDTGEEIDSGEVTFGGE